MDINKQRIDNIKTAIMRGDLNMPVEPCDPVLTADDTHIIVEKHFAARGSVSHRIKTCIAEKIADMVTRFTQKETKIEDEGDWIPRGSIITINHFSPLDSTVVRKYVQKRGGGRLKIVAKDKNFAMKGHLGFLMRYAGTIPLPGEPRQLASLFGPEVERILKNGEILLIYPEAEMWQNYRKPRPLKVGAYHYAAKLGVPVIPMFCEILDKDDKIGFKLHVGEAIYADKSLHKRLQAEDMRNRDYAFKKSVYEKAYGRPLDYSFEAGDIAGV